MATSSDVVQKELNKRKSISVANLIRAGLAVIVILIVWNYYVIPYIHKDIQETKKKEAKAARAKAIQDAIVLKNAKEQAELAEFRHSGIVTIQPGHYAKAWLSPQGGLWPTWRDIHLPDHTDLEGLKYVFVDNPTIVFYDVIPKKWAGYDQTTTEYQQWKKNNEKWLELPTGNYYVYLYNRKYPTTFEWR